ncbi:MAG: FCD domain-containing protein, partial [Pseudomonadota bacterium]
ARIIAARGDAGELDALRSFITKAEALDNPTTRDYFIANRAIHREFMVVAGNRFLLEMFDMIWGRAMAFHLFAAIENTDISQSLGNHIALVDVLATGDRTLALEEFTKHIQNGFDLHIDGIRRSA